MRVREVLRAISEATGKRNDESVLRDDNGRGIARTET